MSAPGDLLAVSSNAQGHFHRATIPARDIADPPPGGADYASTTDSGHANVVQITETQLIDLQERGTLVSVEATIAPGTMQQLIRPILEVESGLKAEWDFHLVHCPERVMAGRLMNNLRKYDRVVGGVDEKSTKRSSASPARASSRR